MDSTTQVEDEVIRDAVSHKLDRPLVNPYNNLWRESTKNITPSSPFRIGDSLRYTNEVHNEMMDLLDINTNDPDNTNYSIKFLRGNTMVLTKQLIKLINVPDI